ncbi:hypothetical protein Tco_0355283 [Tanacetum coccineum]
MLRCWEKSKQSSLAHLRLVPGKSPQLCGPVCCCAVWPGCERLDACGRGDARACSLCPGGSDLGKTPSLVVCLAMGEGDAFG